MTVLVTGGAGFIGSNFIHCWLTDSDEQVVTLDSLTYAGSLKSLEALERDSRHTFVRGDIRDQTLIRELLRQHRPRAILNFAAETHVDRSIHGPGEFVQTNVFGTYNLLECAREYWSSLAGLEKSSFRFLHVSTDEVFGSLGPDDPAFCETDQYKPNSPYSASKAAADHLVRAWHRTYELPTLTTNCSNNYGSFQFPEKFIPLLVLNALTGKPLPIYGDGQQVRDWIFVKDHCLAIACVLRAGRPGETYNIGGESEMTNLTVVRTVCDLLDRFKPRRDGKSYAQQIAFVRDRPGHDRRYSISSKKIREELNWQPLETFESGIAKTIEWYLAHPEWLESVAGDNYRDWLKKQYGS